MNSKFVRLLTEDEKWIYIRTDKVALVEPVERVNLESGQTMYFSEITLDLQLVCGSLAAHRSVVVQYSPEYVMNEIHHAEDSRNE